MAEVRTVDMYKIHKWRIEWEKSGVSVGEEGLTAFRLSVKEEVLNSYISRNHACVSIACST